jgi:iron(III) transport system ATP-binding protein
MRKAKIIVSNLVKYYGSVRAVDRVSLTIHDSEFCIVLGPSGCGKTTLLRCIAGLEKPDDGEIVMNGKVISSRDFVLPPEKRNMGFVFQSYALWPHKTVFDNVAFGLKIRNISRNEIRERVKNALMLVGMDLNEFGNRYPWQLSGGQQQRVALARSLVYEPEVLLLDEPLSNLDAKVRETTRVELKSILRRLAITVVYVTHDQEEAMALGDVLFIMNNGRIVEYGDPATLYLNPKESFTMSFLGLMNSLEGIVVDIDEIDRSGTVKVKNCDEAIYVSNIPSNLHPGGKVSLFIRASDLVVKKTKESQDINSLRGFVDAFTYLGTWCDVLLTVGKLKLRARLPSSVVLKEGEEVNIVLPPNALRVFPSMG